MPAWRDLKESDLATLGKGNSPKPSKYRNVKVVVDNIVFDSKREAQHYHDLKLREKAGEIASLICQVPYALTCRAVDGSLVVVCTYIADFAYLERGEPVVVDAKGVRTAIYQLKKKWLFLQSGIEIKEV